MKKNAEHKPIIIAFCNQKGGTGKTTSTISFAGILAKEYKKKVLIIDGDPQNSISETLLFQNASEEPEYWSKTFNLLDVLEENCDINEAIVKAKIQLKENTSPKWRGIDILPCNQKMVGTEIEEDVIKNKLNLIRRTRNRPYNYDYILIDCPPYLSKLTISLLSASDYVIVPASADADALKGYGRLADTISNLRRSGINVNLKILGVFLVGYKQNESYDQYLYDQWCNIKEFISFPVRRDSNIKKAYEFGRPINMYKKNCNGNKDYRAIIEVVLSRINNTDTDLEKIESAEKLINYYRKQA